jgi:hypothetical protein
MSKLHPTAGARFLFERASATDDDTNAVYRASIFTPDARVDFDVDMAIDGGYDVRACGETAAPDLTKKLDTIAKLIARSASSKKRDGLPPWPHRVLRWRGPGRG